MQNILWLGPVVDPSEVSDSAAISAAANHWQRNLIKSLNNLGNEVLIIGHRPERVWPIGSLRPPRLREDSEFRKIETRYINLPFINRLHISLLYEKKILQQATDDTVLITYNWSPREDRLRYLRQRYKNFKWISVVADGNAPSGADCTIYMSGKAYDKAGSVNSVHFEGGIEEMYGQITPSTEKKILVYAGEYSSLTGIRTFIRQFRSLSLKNIELHLYGKIPTSLHQELATGEYNIKPHGFVSAEELTDRLKGAWAFVNPRDEVLEDALNTFPSKLLLYFRYGKPIISTRSPGIPQKFTSLLSIYDSKSVESLRKVIRQVCSLSVSEYVEVYKYSRSLLTSQKWSVVVCDLVKELRMRGITQLRSEKCTRL